MHIVVVGLSHHTAPVEIRERLAFAPTAMEKPLRQLLALPAVNETLIVSTCNRVELYAVTKEPDPAAAALRRFLADYHGVPLEEIEQHLYDHQGEDAIRQALPVSFNWLLFGLGLVLLAVPVLNMGWQMMQRK